MIGKIAGTILGISCAGLVVAGVTERLHPDPGVEAEIARVELADAAAEGGEVYGTYIFEESGTVLGNVPWKAHVELELERGGRYELRIETEADGDIDVDSNGGRYRIEGDRLVLLDASGNPSDFDKLRIEGDRIRLDAEWPAILALKVVNVGEAALQKKVDAKPDHNAVEAAVEKH